MFSNAKYYFNRELSWLKFNQRVLLESIDSNTPLLERLRFIAIASSNLDEFFMIRVAGLRHQVVNGIIKYDAAHMDAKAQLKAIDESVQRLVSMQSTYLNNVLTELESHGFFFTQPDLLDVKSKAWLRHYFEEHIYPVVTPLAVDSGHPFPFLTNHTINAIVRIFQILPNGTKDYKIAILPIPSVLDRIIEIPSRSNKEHRFVYLEDVITYYANQFFQGYGIEDYMVFRITRDADLEIDEEEATDLLSEVEESLRRRRRGDAVRLEVCGDVKDHLLDFVLTSVELEQKDVYRIDGHLDCRMYFDFCNYPGLDELRYEPFDSKIPSELVDHEGESLFSIIGKQDLFVHHPFESFTVVEQFIAQAAVDPDVLAIKQTLYRVSGDSPIIASLIKAADNGKQVTVLMEVKARFDEENNIDWSKRLEESGCRVIYGLDGLKVHSKLCLITYKNNQGVHYISQVGTGNYNENTSKLYTDLSLMTSNYEIGEEINSIFNHLCLGETENEVNLLMVAPNCMITKIFEHIDNQIALAKAGKEAYIGFKCNSVTSKEMIDKLIEASQAGVKIDMIVRGICCILPGVEGLTDNIRIISIVGRYLEHSRIYIFGKGSAQKVYISSADLMTRNLSRRVEVAAPILDEKLRKRIITMFNTMLKDNVKACRLLEDGTYKRVKNKEPELNSQEYFFK